MTWTICPSKGHTAFSIKVTSKLGSFTLPFVLVGQARTHTLCYAMWACMSLHCSFSHSAVQHHQMYSPYLYVHVTQMLHELHYK